jgi:perosamine synthetase
MSMIPVNRPLLDGNEKRYLAECIETGWVSSEGQFVKRLERDIAERCGRLHGIAVANGTAALEIAVAALRLGPGDEVILPTFTIISCAAAIVRGGAIPVPVDCDPVTWNLDPALVAASITPRTRAIMVVHIYGLPADMDPILALAREHRLAVIEDAAQQLGQHYKGRPVGSLGDISTFSFYPNKQVTTGEGGMIVLDDDALSERCRDLRNLCFDKARRYIHEELGWNQRMSNLQAAVGVAQVERLAATVERKRALGRCYNELLRENTRLQLPLARTEYADNIYWVYGVVLADDVPFDAAEAIARMRKQGIDCRHFFWPMHAQPALKARGLCDGMPRPNAERLARRGFYLPSGPGNTTEDAQRSAEALTRVLK